MQQFKAQQFAGFFQYPVKTHRQRLSGIYLGQSLHIINRATGGEMFSIGTRKCPAVETGITITLLLTATLDQRTVKLLIPSARSINHQRLQRLHVPFRGCVRIDAHDEVGSRQYRFRKVGRKLGIECAEVVF